jgi:hypothetical protein
VQQSHWKEYNEALRARGSLPVWLDKDMRWHGGASGKRGRSPKYSEATIQFCLTMKSLLNLPLRQAMGMTQSLLRLAGLDWQVLDFSTVSRRQKTSGGDDRGASDDHGIAFAGRQHRHQDARRGRVENQEARG